MLGQQYFIIHVFPRRVCLYQTVLKIKSQIINSQRAPFSSCMYKIKYVVSIWPDWLIITSFSWGFKGHHILHSFITQKVCLRYNASVIIKLNFILIGYGNSLEKSSLILYTGTSSFAFSKDKNVLIYKHV